MTLGEFKSWLDGFSEAIGEAPTPGQWAAVKKKLAEVCEPMPFPPVVIPSPLVPASIPGTLWWQTSGWCGQPMTISGGTTKTGFDALSWN